MSGPEQNQFDPGQGDFPKLESALSDLDRECVFVPPTVDEAVLGQARSHLNPVRPGRNLPRLIPRWVAAAACLVLVAVLAQTFFIEPQRQLARTQKEDLDRNGRVDILDAFLLARKIQAGEVLPQALDINGDGIVNLKDIDTIAVKAVALEKRS